jgi:hypothetical protein
VPRHALHRASHLEWPWNYAAARVTICSNYSGELGESLKGFLLDFEELTDIYCLTDKEKVESVFRFMVTEEHHLAKILEGYETHDRTTFRWSLENFYTLRDLIRALRSLSVHGPLYADLYALLLQVCPGAATGL